MNPDAPKDDPNAVGTTPPAAPAPPSPAPEQPAAPVPPIGPTNTPAAPVADGSQIPTAAPGAHHGMTMSKKMIVAAGLVLLALVLVAVLMTAMG